MNRISRLTLTALLVGLMAVVIATPAQAKRFHVTGQQTVITPSAQFTSFLTSHNITVTAVAPATLANGSLTLPIVRGHVATPSLRGKLVHAGAVQFSNGTRTVTLRHFVLTRSHGHARLLAGVAGHRIVLAHLSQVSVTRNGKSGTLSGELLLSHRAAHRINRMFGQHVVSAGADLGKLESSVTVA